jgi:hypothetical protein
MVAALEPALDGVRFGICEVYSDAPPHVASDGTTVSWYFVIDGCTVEVGRGVRTDVDHTIRADYTVAIPYAKQPAHEQARGFAMLDVPDELRRGLMAFHDDMAALTA